MQSFFPFSTRRYFVQKLQFCCMCNSFILHKPQHQLAIKQIKAAQCLCLFSLQHFKTVKSQFSGRSFYKTNTFHMCVSTSIQPRLDVLLLITWSGFLHACPPRGDLALRQEDGPTSRRAITNTQTVTSLACRANEMSQEKLV